VAVPIPRLGGAVCAALLLTLSVPVAGGPAAAAPPGVKCPERRAQLAGQTITSSTKLPDLTCADLRGAVFDGTSLVQANLIGADAQGASFRNARLTQADLTGANLRDADFEHADLGQADLVRADLRGARLGRADLTQAHLNGADLRGADLIHASLTQADLTDADLRGAKTYWTGSIQADVSGVRVDITDPRTFQLSLLAVVVGLALLISSIVTVLRGRARRSSNVLVVAARRLTIYAAAVGLVWLVAGMTLPLLMVDVLYPALVGAVLVLLSGLVHRLAPAGVPVRSGPEGSKLPPGGAGRRR
jgi:uncharacterized protein YjbI with pentapeptide repeats